MSIVVFLGPSLPLADANALIDADIRPPCRMGDVFAATAEKPRAIVIIDGYFEQTPAVWHKEILHALSQGIAVFGGASMGALRAAELRVFGMVGIGAVFEDYASGTLEDDDEVAVAHLPKEAGYQCRSDAMVNIRHGLDLAATAQVISAITRNRLAAAAKQAYYPERSWQALFAVASELGIEPLEMLALRDFLATRQPDRKREDAVAVLKEVAAWSHQDPTHIPVPAPSFQFEPTIFWEHLRTYFATSPQPEDSAVPMERMIHHVRLVGPDRVQLRQRALFLFLVEQEAGRLGLSRAEPKASLERFRRDRGLADPRKLQDWLAGQRVGHQECLDLAALEDVTRSLEWRYTEQVNRCLATVLKLDGAYAGTLETVERKWRWLRDQGIGTPSETDVESADAVIDWYQKEFGTIHTDLQKHVVELGFGSPRQFMSELLAEYLQTRATCHEC
ncbi:MAG: TfuA-like protein [Rhodanobacter sp.]